MSALLKTLGLITGCASVSYLTVTAMMQDPDKPYRGHLNIIRGGISTTNIYTPTKFSENTDVSAGAHPPAARTLGENCDIPQESRSVFTL